MNEQNVLSALREAVKRAGAQNVLAHQARLSQSTISDYLNGRYAVENMTLSVLFRLFPEIAIDFFGGKSPRSGDELLIAQLLEIFAGLSDKDKVKLLAMAAANFGEKLRDETTQS